MECISRRSFSSAMEVCGLRKLSCGGDEEKMVKQLVREKKRHSTGTCREGRILSGKRKCNEVKRNACEKKRGIQRALADKG